MKTSLAFGVRELGESHVRAASSCDGGARPVRQYRTARRLRLADVTCWFEALNADLACGIRASLRIVRQTRT